MHLFEIKIILSALIGFCGLLSPCLRGLYVQKK